MEFSLNKSRSLVAALALGGILTGCGVALNPNALKQEDAGLRDVQDVTQPWADQSDKFLQRIEGNESRHTSARQGCDVRGHFLCFGGAFHGKIAQRLGLNDEQKKQLREIVQNHRVARSPSNRGAYAEELKGLLLAESVDETRLRAFIQTTIDNLSNRATQRVAMFVQMRAILTAEQRADLVRILSEEGHDADKAKMRDHVLQAMAKNRELMRAKLNLTKDQSAAIEALTTKVKTVVSEVRPQLKLATIAFVESGDEAAFASALRKSILRRVPTDEIVRAAAILNKEQRTMIVEKCRRILGMRSSARMRFRPHP